MADSSSAPKKTARHLDFQAMMEQARAGAQERSKIDWESEIEKSKEENDARIAEMKSRADEAAKKIQMKTTTTNDHDDDDDDDYFGPSLNLAKTHADDNSSDDDNDVPINAEIDQVRENHRPQNS